jgi:hypothetical protein
LILEGTVLVVTDEHRISSLRGFRVALVLKHNARLTDYRPLDLIETFLLYVSLIVIRGAEIVSFLTDWEQ